jgi:hypothetical protein
MSSPDGRLDLEFTPFVERVAQTNVLLIASEVHQMFGRYTCTAHAWRAPAATRRTGRTACGAVQVPQHRHRRRRRGDPDRRLDRLGRRASRPLVIWTGLPVPVLRRQDVIEDDAATS